MRTDIDTEYFKNKLNEEKALVEEELGHLGRKNPDKAGDWEATTPQDLEVDSADDSETADRLEQFEENAAVMNTLELRLGDLNKALGKIDGSSNLNEYGMCEVCGEPIEKERLEANPSAKTCIKHM